MEPKQLQLCGRQQCDEETMWLLGATNHSSGPRFHAVDVNHQHSWSVTRKDISCGLPRTRRKSDFAEAIARLRKQIYTERNEMSAGIACHENFSSTIEALCECWTKLLFHTVSLRMQFLALHSRLQSLKQELNLPNHKWKAFRGLASLMFSFLFYSLAQHGPGPCIQTEITMLRDSGVIVHIKCWLLSAQTEADSWPRLLMDS